jgi:hypothetical protein
MNPTRDDLMCRAYVNLTILRDKLPSGRVHEEALFRIFNQSLEELRQAGLDLNEWRLPEEAVEKTDAQEFRSRIDAIMTYFSVRDEKVKLRFRSKS